MADKLLLGLNTAMIGMGIVFGVLIVLWAVIVLQSKLISFLSERFKKSDGTDFPLDVDKVDIDRKDTVDDETQAVIIAVISHYANIPLSKLQIKSIKRFG